jgi:hypothetical protein
MGLTCKGGEGVAWGWRPWGWSDGWQSGDGVAWATVGGLQGVPWVTCSPWSGGDRRGGVPPWDGRQAETVLPGWRCWAPVWTCGVFPVWETETVGVVFHVGLPG